MAQRQSDALARLGLLFETRTIGEKLVNLVNSVNSDGEIAGKSRLLFSLVFALGNGSVSRMKFTDGSEERRPPLSFLIQSTRLLAGVARFFRLLGCQMKPIFGSLGLIERTGPKRGALWLTSPCVYNGLVATSVVSKVL
jgi:hypothetical protein